MKNKLSILAIIFSTAITIIYSCKKNSETELKTDRRVKSTQVIEPNYMKAKCDVPIGYTSCIADCLFTDCCVVWDPAVQTGGCACYFGFSSCKTEVLKKNPTERVQRINSNGLESQRTIRIRYKKVEQFFSYCTSNRINIQDIELAFTAVKSASLSTTDDVIVANPAIYDTFIYIYNTTVNSLSADKLALVKYYIGE